MDDFEQENGFQADIDGPCVYMLCQRCKSIPVKVAVEVEFLETHTEIKQIEPALCETCKKGVVSHLN